MKRLLIALIATLSTVMLGSAPVLAQEFEPIENDYSVLKEVKVNDGAFADANDSGSALSAVTTDTITWRITVSYSGSNEPFTVFVQDLIPSGLTYISASSVNFDMNSGIWAVPNLSPQSPQVLEIVTSASQIGEYTNEAVLGYMSFTENEDTIFNSGFEDTNGQNNRDSAVVLVAEKQQDITVVLGDTTTTPSTTIVLSDTGQPILTVILTMGLVVSLVALLAHYTRTNTK